VLALGEAPAYDPPHRRRHPPVAFQRITQDHDMATIFPADPQAFAAHKDYVAKLKDAVKQVKAEPGTRFLFVKAYPFTDGKKTVKKPLMLVSFDPKLKDALKAAKVVPLATGLVNLTKADELDFVAEKKGSLNRRSVQTMFKALGVPKAVHVPADEPADSGSGVADESGEGDASGEASLQAQPEVRPQANAKPLPQVPVRSEPSQAQPKPLPTVPPDMLLRIRTLGAMPLQPEWEAKKRETLEAALQLVKAGKPQQAAAVLDGLERKALQAKVTPKPLPKRPVAEGALGNDSGEDTREDDTFDDEDDEDDNYIDDVHDAVPREPRKRLVPRIDAEAAKKAAQKPAVSVASAQQRLKEEEAAFAQRKTANKSDKIKVSDSQKEEARRKEEAEKLRQAEKAQAKLEAGEKGFIEALFSRRKDSKLPKEEQEKQDRIDRAQANKKVDDEIKKFTDAPLAGVKYASVAEKAIASGLDKVLDPAVGGDNIASAAGALATSSAGAASSLVEMGREFRLYANTRGAERTVHLNKAAAALGSAFGNIVNMTKGALNVAEQSNALDAGSAVPILGIVATLPTLLSEINALRSAMTRLAKQEKVHLKLQKQIADGDTTQVTLEALVASFIARDGGNVAKGIANITLDFTKIAGHGVAAGGITGPIGVALVAVGSAGKLVVSGATKIEDLVDANRANLRRKKLQPTLKAQDGWKDMRKEKPDAPENVELGAALEVLATVEKGTPAHAAALERVSKAAAVMKSANAKAPKLVAFAEQLIEQVAQEKESWDGADEDDGGTAATATEDPNQRNARKLIARDPQMAAQMLIDQALREGGPGGPAFRVLKSYGIKETQLYGGAEGDDRIANIREMRQKVLHKMGASDETAQTLSQTVRGAKDTAASYLSMPSKMDEMEDYAKAKDLLEHGGRRKRGPGWRLKMNLLTDDIEEKKQALLLQVDHLLAKGDIDPVLANAARELLRPRKEKPQTA
jgi:hypothetical protein